MFIKPTTPSARDSFSAASAINLSLFGPMENGGSTHAESPEWAPASSMCSMIPPM
jgi:hypothetical protein